MIHAVVIERAHTIAGAFLFSTAASRAARIAWH
jgi:hypothetical protein